MYLAYVSSSLSFRHVDRTNNTQNPSPSNQYSSHSGLKSFTKADTSWDHSSLACFVTETKFLAWYITEATAQSKSSPSETRITAFSSERPSFRAYPVRSSTELCYGYLHELGFYHLVRFEKLARRGRHHQQREKRGFCLGGLRNNKGRHLYQGKSATFRVEEQAMVTTTGQVRTIYTRSEEMEV